VLNKYPKLAWRRPTLKRVHYAFWDALANHPCRKELSEFVELKLSAENPFGSLLNLPP